MIGLMTNLLPVRAHTLFPSSPRKDKPDTNTRGELFMTNVYRKCVFLLVYIVVNILTVLNKLKYMYNSSICL